MNPQIKKTVAALAMTAALTALPLCLQAQVAPAPVPETASPTAEKIPVEKKPATEVADDSVIELSPFEVTSNNNGYFASNTMSGTRMNSKIEDLGQSLTVMTKEQMTDFAMLDINDVFDHMASTEGTGSYSQFETDRTGAVVDQVSLNPNNANRVRGIGNANTAFNNFATTGRVPVDPLWMESLELSRGPNANIFGLGNASGTVNQVPATANLSRNFNRMEIRADSYEGWRVSIDSNSMLIKGKLALRASYAKEHVGFIREPSGEDRRRFSVQAKARPYKNTTISLSLYNYTNTAVRPNFTTPRDYYTGWIAAGQPGWNPITGLVTMANGQIYQKGDLPYTPSSTAPIPYTATPGFFSGVENRSVFRIGAVGETPYWALPRYSSGATATTDPYPSQTGIGLLNTSPSQSYTAAQQPLFNSVVRPIADQSIYDWTSINLAGNSKAWDDVRIYLGQLDQIFINTSKQTLAAQLAVMREDARRLENQPMGPASVNSNVGQLQVDVNQFNLDGSKNPYFGRPYLRSNEPYLRDKPQMWDTARAQVAYKVDFSRDRGLTKWLGAHQLIGYYEYKDQQNRQYAYRHSATALETPWQLKYDALRAPLGNRVQQTAAIPETRYTLAPGNYARINEQYYVGNTVGGGIEYAPSYFPEGTTIPYVWGNSATTMKYDPALIGFTPSYDAGGGGANVQTIIKTKGGVLQSTLLNGTLVGTFGLRQDDVFDHNAPLPTLTPDLRAYDFSESNKWNEGWRSATGKTKSFSLVGRPFREIKFLQEQAKGGSGVGRFLAEMVNGLSLTYNKADNFIAQGPAYDLFLNQLPNQTGTSKDIGFWMTMLDGKLSIRYTNFNTKQLNLRNGDITTMAQRVLRLDGFVSNDRWNLRSQSTAWLGGTATNEQIAAAIKIPLAQYNGLQTIVANNTYAAVMDSESKGDELEINFNPAKAWTVSASVTKTQAINTAAGSAVEDFIAMRMPVWTTIEDPRFTSTTYTPPVTIPPGVPATYTTTLPVGPTGHLLWWNIFGSAFGSTTAGYDANNSAATNFASNVEAPLAVFREMVGRPRPQIRKYTAKFTPKYSLSGFTDHKILKAVSVGGSVRWSDKGAIGFYGLGYDPSKDLKLPANKILKLDSTRPIYSPSETYVDLFVSYKTKLFRDKIRANFQLNVKNVGENGGGLQATSAFLDGTPSTYRIIDPRQFILSASFEL